MADQERIERRLAAIFAADVAGYSRLMADDEVGTLRALTAHREVMDRLIEEHGGRIANTAGDSVLAAFPSAVDAVQCAVEIQKALTDLNAGMDQDRALCFRIGKPTRGNPSASPQAMCATSMMAIAEKRSRLRSHSNESDDPTTALTHQACNGRVHLRSPLAR